MLTTAEIQTLTFRLATKHHAPDIVKGVITLLSHEGYTEEQITDVFQTPDKADLELAAHANALGDYLKVLEEHGWNNPHNNIIKHNPILINEDNYADLTQLPENIARTVYDLYTSEDETVILVPQRWTQEDIDNQRARAKKAHEELMKIISPEEAAHIKATWERVDKLEKEHPEYFEDLD